MEVADLSDLLNVRAVKMENNDNFEDSTDGVENSDPLSVIPQFVTENDLGLMQSGGEILQTPLTVFSDPIEEEDTSQSNEGEVIIQLMDIRTRLSSLRTMLENRLGADLSDYTFWLQDAKMLESHKTLVEQCIRGTGAVQVNIQLSAAERKINILDVLKPDEELLQVTDGAELEECPERAPTPPAPPHAAAVKWVVDAQFQCDQNRLKIHNDPAMWTVQHVKLWIQWAVRQFNLTRIKLSDWSLSGRQLCAMTNQEFKEKVPSDPGDIFWTHFELLRKCRFIAVIQNDSSEKEVKEKKILPQTPSTIKKKKPKPPTIPTTKDDELCALGVARSCGQVQLWQFLLELLTGAEYYELIRWVGTQGEFKLLEPERVAYLWGKRKHKPAMNYEKLSRALRYYYDGDMISKVAGKRFVYKFVCDLKQLLGYDAAELALRVQEARARDEE